MAHDHSTLKFPDNFLWGTATSSHQVEGNNTNNDWWEWEKSQPESKRSGSACDQYNLFESDFKLIKELSQNTHRLSIEWSRIESSPGVFDQAEIDHYKDVLRSLKEKNITVMLTLHHFSNPLWFSKKGGWLNFRSPYYFQRFVKRIVPEFREYVDFWLTINEPIGYANDAYGRGKFPPNIRAGLWGVIRASWNMSQAHKKAYKVIHSLIPNCKVGLAHNVTSFNSLHKHSLLENLGVWFLDNMINHTIYKFTGIKTHDFLALNYYFNSNVSKVKNKKLPQPLDVSNIKPLNISDMGWEVRPEGIFEALTNFSSYNLPIYITENGIASENDDRRVRFLLSFLQEVYHAIQAGVKVKGYYYWSLMDNYEWVEGFSPKFGLIEIDHMTQQRFVRPSALVYQQIIKENGIPHKLLKLLGHGLDVEKELENLK